MISTLPAVQLCQKVLTIVPAHSLNWTVRTLEVGRIAAHHGLPLRLCHFISSKFKPVRDPHAVRRFLAVIAFFIAVRTTHHELAGWDADEFHTGRGIAYGRVAR